jgi:MarR family transcriptional repressor of emrRAB
MSFQDDLKSSLQLIKGAPVLQELATRELIRAATLLHECINTALVDDDINMQGFLALSAIALHKDGKLRPSELGLLLDLTRTQVTRLLDTLTQQRLVVRSRSSQDGRALNLKLTLAGQHKVEQCMPKVNKVYKNAWKVVSDCQALLHDLRALSAHLNPSGTTANQKKAQR